MAVDMINLFMDVVWPPTALMLLGALYPMMLFIRFWSWVFNFMFPENMHNKVVIITGASSGIGEKTAYEYAKRGAKLVLAARREHLLRDVAERARRHGALDVRIIRADVSKREDCKRIIDETINHYGHLDHLVNNAGVGTVFLLQEAKPQALQHCVDVTFWGNVLCTYYALPHLRRSKGRVVVNDSVCGFVPYPRLSIYCAAKAAKLQFYNTLMVELGSSVGITIVCPGWIESQMTQGKFINADGVEKWSDPTLRDMVVGPSPVAYTEVAAKAIYHGAVHRKRFVTVPFWYYPILYYRVFAPEVLEWFERLFFIVPVTQDKKPLSKVVLDASGLKPVFYPPSILRPPQVTGGKAE